MEAREATRAAWAPARPYRPYGEEARDRIYSCLFADDGAAFEGTGIAFGPEAGVAALTALARDEGAEARMRALAFRSLRALGTAPGELPLLGVIVEVGMQEGLDALAAYADGSARYMNHAGGMSVVEGKGVADPEIRALIVAARPVALAIGSWTEARRPPPTAGIVRLSFLVGDELRFGEGPIEVIARDAAAGPAFAAATRLLMKLAELVQPS